MHNFIIAYDIFDKKRLSQVRKIVYSYTLGGQKSALEAPLDNSLMKSLVKELKTIIEDEDKINIIKISNTILLGRSFSYNFKLITRNISRIS